jgi:geranylgeranyl pyrophosphate synthase
MLDIIANKIKQLKSFESELNQTIEQALRLNESTILAMNYNTQLFNKGIDSEGKKIRPKYTLGTIKKKKKKGQPTNRVTLKDEGIFHNSFYISLIAFMQLYISSLSLSETCTL